jgi:SSS family solute:Na+ symporter
MDSYSVFLTLLAGYISFLFIIGYLFNRRQISLREFLLGGRRAGPLSIGFSAAASWLTAGALLAVIGFFMLLGMGSIWGFVAPNILALLALALIVPKIRSIPAMTQPELLEIRYGSFLRIPVALIIIVVMILFTVADIKGFAMVLQVFYGIDTMQAAIIVGLSVAVYVTLGGLSAVIATDIIQYLCLAGFILVMAVLVMTGAGEVSEMNKKELFFNAGSSWWNPLSIGLPMILIFCVAILPGWVSEQDPWQKIWAARDEKSAQKNMVIGAILVLVAFSGCGIIALGLNVLYPEIGAMGFPMGLAKGESALLVFIMDSGFSDFTVALCGVALATAAMSCADTFAASGASCIARDIYQRYLNPAASVKQMILINRLSVLIIIGCSVIGSFFIESIIDAIHIATFIASASYFFALMGGIYWKRGTGVGAGASLIIGFVLQSTLIIIDLIATQKGAPPYLESFHHSSAGKGSSDLFPYAIHIGFPGAGWRQFEDVPGRISFQQYP